MALKPVELGFKITAGFPYLITVCPSSETAFAQELLRLVNIVSVSHNHRTNTLALRHRKPPEPLGHERGIELGLCLKSKNGELYGINQD